MTAKTFQEHNARMVNKVGRPGIGRAKFGLIRASIDPAIKEQAEGIAHADSRLRSLSQFMEAAATLYLREYKRAGGVLDKDNLP
ncbi:MAG: hypothetical protein HQL97_00235, partial [Magnetococcales bacterium]|nr:hypothetical protein [Magnetococcales bacterium]